jgi:hypothetical protein
VNNVGRKEWKQVRERAHTSSALEVENQSVAVYVFAKKKGTPCNADLLLKTQGGVAEGQQVA